MKKTVLTLVALTSVAAMTPAAEAGTPGWTGDGIIIRSMGSGSDGNLLFIDISMASQGCPEAYTLRIGDSQSNLNRIWSLAALALASNMRVQFYLTGNCLGRGAEVSDIRVLAN